MTESKKYWKNALTAILIYFVYLAILAALHLKDPGGRGNPSLGALIGFVTAPILVLIYLLINIINYSRKKHHVLPSLILNSLFTIILIVFYIQFFGGSTN